MLAEDLALERVIAERPDDDDARLVYGDWLQERGDPRGALCAAQAKFARAPGRRLEKEIRELERRCAAALWPGLERAPLAARWRLGQLDALSVTHLPPGDALDGAPTSAVVDLWELLARSPARFLRELRAYNFSFTDDRIERLPKTLRALVLETSYDRGVPLAQLYPHLEELRALAMFLVGGVDLGRLLKLPSLERLATAFTRARHARAIVGSRWESLRELVLLCGEDVAISELQPLFRGNGFPSLRALTLEMSSMEEVARALGEAKIARELESVTLAGALTDEAARELAARARAFASLRALVVYSDATPWTARGRLEKAFGWERVKLLFRSELGLVPPL